MDKTTKTAFELSRIYAQGWNTARRISATGEDPMEQDFKRLNPYAKGPEHIRWNDGYSDAFAKPGTR